MYEIAKRVIERKDYDLADMIQQLKGYRLSGDITDDQLAELIDLARTNAAPHTTSSLWMRLEDHENRLRAIEKQLADGTTPPPELDPEYPAWVAGRAYRNGDKVTYKGKRYVCKLNEYTDSTTFSPEDYPAYWQLVS